jgi:hypothetical protein
MTAARDRLAALVAEVPWDQPWPDAQAPGSVKAAREFFIRCRATPLWVGLLAILEDFADTWDVMPEKKPDEILCRDGFRCGAPGCGSRRNNQIHHVEYRSRGGGQEDSNKLDLCAWHHLRGEHQGLASVRGKAPLDLVWTLGRNGIGGTFVNERRVSSPSPGT